jgi:hypothetical protein
VVVLYDYKGQRSDELTIFAGEQILLLYKDSDLWWMGEKEDGMQGFFPANYVTMHEDEEDDDMRKSVSVRKSMSVGHEEIGECEKIGECWT